MKRIKALGLAVALVMGLAGQAQGQVTLGPTLALGDDADFGIGATIGLPLEALGPELGLLGDVVIFFPDGPVDYFEVNANLTYDFPLENSTVVPFLLGGLNIARVSIELPVVGDRSDTELGLNLGGGIDFDLGTVRPTVGIKAEVEGGEELIVWATLPFQIGS